MKIIILLMILFSTNLWAQQEQAEVMKSIVELSIPKDHFWDCMEKPEFLGFCPRPTKSIPVGVKFLYWEPDVFMETVKTPGDHVIAEWGTLLGGLYKEKATADMRSSSSIGSLTVTSGSSFGSLNASNLQFNEAHIYDFPLEVIFKFFGADIPDNMVPGVPFVSELNSVMWRTGKLFKDSPDLLASERLIGGHTGPYCHDLPLGQNGCMQSWGSLFPRQGFVTTPSPVVASVVDGLRAVSAATPTSPYIIKIPLDFDVNISIDKVQMVYPNRTECLHIGDDPKLWEEEFLKNQQGEDRYVWILWHRRVRCFGVPT